MTTEHEQALDDLAALRAERAALCRAVSVPEDASQRVLAQAVAGYRTAYLRADANASEFWRRCQDAERDRDVLAAGFQAWDSIVEWSGGDPQHLEAAVHGDAWIVSAVTETDEGEREVETMLELYDSDDPCLAAGLTAEDLAKRLASQVNEAVELAERLKGRSK